MTDDNSEGMTSPPGEKGASTGDPSMRWRRATQALKAAGVAVATVHYAGGHGIVGVFGIDNHDVHGKRLPQDTVSDDVCEEILRHIAQLLDQRHPQWYEGTGSFGVFEWNVLKDGLQHLHHQRYIDVKTSSREGL
jgi:hypothetical protein